MIYLFIIIPSSCNLLSNCCLAELGRVLFPARLPSLPCIQAQSPEVISRGCSSLGTICTNSTASCVLLTPVHFRLRRKLSPRQSSSTFNMLLLLACISVSYYIFSIWFKSAGTSCYADFLAGNDFCVKCNPSLNGGLGGIEELYVSVYKYYWLVFNLFHISDRSRPCSLILQTLTGL